MRILWIALLLLDVAYTAIAMWNRRESAQPVDSSVNCLRMVRSRFRSNLGVTMAMVPLIGLRLGESAGVQASGLLGLSILMAGIAVIASLIWAGQVAAICAAPGSRRSVLVQGIPRAETVILAGANVGVAVWAWLSALTLVPTLWAAAGAAISLVTSVILGYVLRSRETDAAEKGAGLAG